VFYDFELALVSEWLCPLWPLLLLLSVAPKVSDGLDSGVVSVEGPPCFTSLWSFFPFSRDGIFAPPVKHSYILFQISRAPELSLLYAESLLFFVELMQALLTPVRLVGGDFGLYFIPDFFRYGPEFFFPPCST